MKVNPKIIQPLLGGILSGLFSLYKSKTEAQTAQELSMREKDPNVSYTVVQSWDDVGRILNDMVNKFHADVSEYDEMPFEEYYNFVKNLPYIPDDEKAGDYDIDVFCRPKRTLGDDCVCRDCDDKAILMACWLKRHGVRYRFVACSYEAKNPHEHCILEVYNEGKWMELDATYPEDTFPSWRKYHNKIVL